MYALSNIILPKVIKKAPCFRLGLWKTILVQFTIAQHDHQDFVLMYLVTILLRL
jgi:hypothetical protein